MKQWRLIIDPPGEAEWNMAVDETLLGDFGHEGHELPVLRLYSWKKPAISLGHFQDTGMLGMAADELADISIVKRCTGGGAVLHGGDLSYSIVSRAGIDVPYELLSSYAYLCQGIIFGLKRLGLTVGYGHNIPNEHRPVSCFQQSTPTDLTWQGQKLIGSAQCRQGDVILQHGSIQIKEAAIIAGSLNIKDLPDTFIPGNATCLEKVLGRELPFEEVTAAIVEGFREALKADFKLLERKPV